MDSAPPLHPGSLLGRGTILGLLVCSCWRLVLHVCLRFLDVLVSALSILSMLDYMSSRHCVFEIISLLLRVLSLSCTL